MNIDSFKSLENTENVTICCPYRYRTMAKTLSCDYTMDLPNFEHISPHGKDFISKLLVLDPKVICLVSLAKKWQTIFQQRLTAEQCLSHPWMTDNRVRKNFTQNNISKFCQILLLNFPFISFPNYLTLERGAFN